MKLKVNLLKTGYIHINEIKRCSKCKGAGELEVREEDGPKVIVCDTCQGEGMLRIQGVLQASPFKSKSQH